LVFSHQYYFFFLAFDVDLPYLTMIATISSVYFLASSLPTFQFWTLPLKEVLLFISSGFRRQRMDCNFISLMWFLNVVLPVVIGSYFVLNFKPQLRTSRRQKAI
jgi:hypothetical protein